MSHSTLVVSSALLVALLCASTPAQTYKLKPVDSVSVSPNTNGVWRDNRHRAYTGSGSPAIDLHGLLKFDLTQIPDTVAIVSMKLTCTLENAFSSPRNNPVVNLHYSPDDNWTRANATASAGRLGAILTADQKNFQLPTHVFTIDVSAHTWATDLKDNFLTLAIDNVNPAYSYVYFYGSGGTPSGTPPELEIVTASSTCNGGVVTIGVGGKDSTSTEVTAVATGCPKIGSLITLGASYKANAPMTLYVGLSDHMWQNNVLPLDMAPFGAPNNFIYISLDLPVAQRASAGAIPIVIPNDVAFKGVTAFTQTAVFDAGANPMGVVAGPGQRVTISN